MPASATSPNFSGLAPESETDRTLQTADVLPTETTFAQVET